MMEKAYEHGRFEDGLYARWEASGKMRANAQSEKPPFVIPLPPPNVTGQLHLGHAAMLAIEDILIRFKAMTGHEVLWLPGTDHAAIATENVVRKKLGLQKRDEMPKEEFMREARKFAAGSHDTIVNQMKKMGAWLDWSRESYTFDADRNFAVNAVFRQLYDDGLIERGYRMINWSVDAQSVIADDEVEWEERTETLYHIQCGEFVISTVRPETKCADSAMVVNPEDPRYKHLIGQKFTAMTYAGEREFHVIGDEHIDPEFGSGAMTISTAHDANDYAIAKRHDLPFVTKIGFDGRMTDVAGPCAGMTVMAAREKSVAVMREMGLIVKEETYPHNVPLCYRTGCVIEPMLSDQWFVVVEKPFTDRHTGETTTLKQLTADAVRGGEVRIIPERFEKTYFSWIDNLLDWCISRQIWWGHSIPIWYDAQGGVHHGVAKEICLVRHGESEDNAANRVQRDDTPLTAAGRAQAEALAEELAQKNITKLVTSPLRRAVETAEIVSAKLGLEYTVVDDWATIDLGGLKGEARTEDLSALFYAEERTEGETVESFRQRIAGAYAVLKQTATAGNIAVIAHRSVATMVQLIRRDRPNSDMKAVARDHGFGAYGDVLELGVIQSPQLYTEEPLRAEEDTLDTWFSSALWPVSPLGWPQGGEDFAKFYPADVLETGHDILFFWVARMIMFGRYLTGEYPFHTVYLHGLVCDAKGKKMSKSKGNGIDPLEMIAQYGADAVRLSLVVGSTPGNNIPIGPEKIGGYRNFVNKLWNAVRFVQMKTEGVAMTAATLQPESLAERWVGSRFTVAQERVRTALQGYEISRAGDTIYHFVWDEYCAWFLESAKAGVRPVYLLGLMGEVLKLVHPLCPFITETCWGELYGEACLLEMDFPKLTLKDEVAEAEFALVQGLVTAVRQVRANLGVGPREKLETYLSGVNCSGEMATLAEVLGGLGQLTVVETLPELDHGVRVELDHGGTLLIDVPYDADAERERLDKELAQLDKQRGGLEGRLANPKYTEKAPPALVQQTRDQLTAVNEKITKVRAQRAELG